MEKTLFIINQNMLKFINLSRFCFLSNEYFFIILYIFNKFYLIVECVLKNILEKLLLNTPLSKFV